MKKAYEYIYVYYCKIIETSYASNSFRFPSRLYNSIANKIAAKKTIVIASTSLLIAVGPIAQNLFEYVLYK